ncbi:PREDICTED: uncharacterized protein LOC109155063 [Ipomoea nil]|uniref:uncharacterized protein LOC109155063 n=1 Tax=Ipomoea nil TaxID=35883 RepID=UPI0009013437|nr:PREDICTED: uncharacterized protein LOC109155063 [Ipomoea nil]
MSEVTNTAFDVTPVQPLTGGLNYKIWATKMIMLLESKDVDYVLFEYPVKFNMAVIQPTMQITASSASTDPKSTGASKDPKSPSAQASSASKAIRIKYEKDNKTARTTILQRVITDPLFDMFLEYKSAKVIWDLMIEKYGVDDVGRRKYAVGRWLHFKIVDTKPVIEQVHKFENLVGDMKVEGSIVNEVVLCDSLIDKLPDSWVDLKNKMNHDRRNYTLQQLINSVNIEEENRLVQRSVILTDNVKANIF